MGSIQYFHQPLLWLHAQTAEYNTAVMGLVRLKLLLVDSCDTSIPPIYTHRHSINESCQCRREPRAPASVHRADVIRSIHVLKGKRRRQVNTGCCHKDFFNTFCGRRLCHRVHKVNFKKLWCITPQLKAE